MGKNLSRDQKRKVKLKKREERSGKQESLAYHGTKYRAPAYVPIIHRTEIGIYESYVMSDRTLTDDEVEDALGRLIIQVRQKALPTNPEGGPGASTGEPPDMILWNIRRNWEILADRQQLPPREDLIGVLRTILSSLETWRAKSLHSQGYLRYIEEFMKETGVIVQRVKPESLISER